jgi:hypothetical protein
MSRLAVVVVVVIVVAFVLAACAGVTSTSQAAGRAARGVRLVAVATCTQMLCPGGSCCNACTFGGWFDEKRGLRAVAGPRAPALPACEVDGCGRCAFELDADGEPRGETFVVSAWRRKPSRR